MVHQKKQIQGSKKRDDNEKKIERAFDILGYGQIEDFIQDEDIDSEDMVSVESESSDNSISESEEEDELVQTLPPNLSL